MKIWFKKIFDFFVYGFAIIGAILIFGFVFSKSNITKEPGVVDKKTDYFELSRKLVDNQNYTWLNTEEYTTLKESLKKEKVVLDRIEKETNIKPRLLVSILFVEQMRLYNSDRELFKKVFEPLKLLGVQSQYSWGVLGLKQETLIQIEENEKKEGGKRLDFVSSTKNIDEERFMRVTDEHNHYYTYLYAAIFLKQLENQWSGAGFPISDRPEILATLYNIGFANSKPKANPEVGGAEIEIGNSKTSFGRLAYEFYYSDELLNIYPR
jgi:hypothetical protein